MRHRLRTGLGVTAALSLLLLLGGCGKPSGLDGDLVNGWAAIGEPTGFTPVAGTCHLANFAIVGTRGVYEDGRLRDQAPDRDGLRRRVRRSGRGGVRRRPPRGPRGRGRRTRSATSRPPKFVGAPWRTGRLWIGVTQPSAAAWAGGARWFRCEVLEISSIEDDGGLVHAPRQHPGRAQAGRLGRCG